MGRTPDRTVTEGKKLYDRLFNRQKYRKSALDDFVEAEAGGDDPVSKHLAQRLATYMVNESVSPYFTYLTQVEKTTDYKTLRDDIHKFAIKNKQLDDVMFDQEIRRKIKPPQITFPALGVSTKKHKQTVRKSAKNTEKRQREDDIPEEDVYSLLPPPPQPEMQLPLPVSAQSVNFEDIRGPKPRLFTKSSPFPSSKPVQPTKQPGRPKIGHEMSTQTTQMQDASLQTERVTEDDEAEWDFGRIFKYITNSGKGTPEIQRIQLSDIRDTDNMMRLASKSLITYVGDSRLPYYYFEDPQRVAPFIEPYSVTTTLVSLQSEEDKRLSTIEKMGPIDDYSYTKDRLYDSIDLFFISMLCRCSRINQYDPSDAIETFKRLVTNLDAKSKLEKQPDTFSQWFNVVAPAYVNYTVLLYGYMANVISIAGKDKSTKIFKEISQWIEDVVSLWYTNDGIVLMSNSIKYAEFLSVKTNIFISRVVPWRTSVISFKNGAEYSASKRKSARTR